MIDEERQDIVENLFLNADDALGLTDADDVIHTPVLVIDLDEVNGDARRQAEVITERMSGYYFDEKYLKEHPYVPAKIAQEIDIIRRLLKMLCVNEKAQDALITNITSNAGKGALYQSLTSLQNSTLSIQSQLNTTIEKLETIFKDMQNECEKTFSEKPKEEALEDGSIIVRGSREFIKNLAAELHGTQGNVQTMDSGDVVDTDTGEVISKVIDDEHVADYNDIVATAQ